MEITTGRGLRGYQLSGKIAGSGGLEVYRAIAPGGQRLVFIRIFPNSPHPSSQRMRRWQKAFDVLSRISHPNICTLVDWGQDSGKPFLVVSYLDAGSLEDRMRTRTLSTLDKGKVIEGIGAGLTCAHTHGLMHGALTPQNVLIDGQDQVKLVGFGERAILGSPNGYSRESMAAYQAPEIFEGGTALPQSDQYSFGVIALQMFTKQPPGEGLSALRAYRMGKRDNTNRRSHSLRLPPKGVIAVLLRALSESPSDRYSTMDEMCSSLLAAHDPSLETKPLPSLAW